jgi:hypothetical protein
LTSAVVDPKDNDNLHRRPFLSIRVQPRSLPETHTFPLAAVGAGSFWPALVQIWPVRSQHATKQTCYTTATMLSASLDSVAELP